MSFNISNEWYKTTYAGHPQHYGIVLGVAARLKHPVKVVKILASGKIKVSRSLLDGRIAERVTISHRGRHGRTESTVPLSQSRSRSRREQKSSRCNFHDDNRFRLCVCFFLSINQRRYYAFHVCCATTVLSTMYSSRSRNIKTESPPLPPFYYCCCSRNETESKRLLYHKGDQTAHKGRGGEGREQTSSQRTPIKNKIKKIFYIRE